MDRRKFIRLAGGGVVLAATLPTVGCSNRMPPDAIAAWKGPKEETDVRKWILSYAILAPHSHNLQSWLVDLRVEGEIMLYCDLRRVLPETDPFYRQIMMSHGTFLELLEMAALERGLRAEIEYFPSGDFSQEKIDGRPVARIHLVSGDSPRTDPLFAQILKRRTNREPYQADKIVPADAVRAMEEAAGKFPVRFGFASDQLPNHRAIAADAWKIELTTPAKILETYNVLRIGPDEIAKYKDGISINNAMLGWLVKFGLFDRTKAPSPDSSATRDQIEKFEAALTSTPGFMWLVTEGNERRQQIDAGRAYVRVQLAATEKGLSMQPISQALQEYPEVRGPYEAVHTLLGAQRPKFTVQMWARVGYGPELEPAPRRGLDSHLIS